MRLSLPWLPVWLVALSCSPPVELPQDTPRSVREETAAPSLDDANLVAEICRLGPPIAERESPAEPIVEPTTHALVVPDSLSLAVPLSGHDQTFEIALRAGEALDLQVEQRGTDLALSLHRETLGLVREVDSLEAGQGVEPLPWVAEVDTRYELRIRPLGAVDPTITRPLLTATRHPATPEDRHRAAGEDSLWQAKKALRDRRFDAAVRSIREAQSSFQSLPDDRGRIADAAYLEGIIQLQASRADLAQEPLERAQKLYTDASRATLHADTLNTLGHVLRLQGKTSEAKATLHHALLLQQRLGQQRLGQQRGEAVALNNLGQCYAQSEDSTAALDFYHRAESIYWELGDHLSHARTSGNSGDLHLALSDPEGARTIYCAGLDSLRRVGAQSQVAESIEASLMAGLSIALFRSGEKEHAPSLLRHAEDAFQRLGRRSLRAIAQHNLAWLALGEKRYDEARLRFEEAARLFAEIGDRNGQASASLHLGHIALLSSSEPAAATQALAAFQQARHLADGAEKSALRSEIEAGLALALERLGRFEEGLDHNSVALELLERRRTKPPTPLLQAEVLADHYRIFETHVRLLMQVADLADRAEKERLWRKALTVSETARSRSLLDGLARRRVDLRHGVDPQLRDALQESERTLNQLEERRHALSQKIAWSDDEETERWIQQLLGTESRLRQARVAHSQAQSLLTLHNPLVHYDTADIRRQIDALRHSLPASTVVLVYFLGKEHSVLWKVTTEDISAFRLPPAAQIDRLVQQLRRDLPQLHGTLRPWPTPAARQLSDELLGPVAQELGSQRLWIVVDGSLHYVPLEVLPDPAVEGSPQPLGTLHEIAYLPSLGVMQQLRQRCAASGVPSSIAVLADPIYSDDPRAPVGVPEGAAARASIEARGKPPGTSLRLGLGRLRFSEQEAQAIATAAGSIPTRVATGAEASKALVLSGALSGYPILHFATHGFTDADSALGSSLALSMFDAQGRSLEPSLLPVRDIYNLDLPAQLVVLSACSTGLGREIRGEGLVGLPHGFFSAGAAQVVVSSWTIDDAATAYLMASFYDAMLRQGLPPAAALLVARQNAWKQQDPNRASPQHWGAFRLLGDCSAIKN